MQLPQLFRAERSGDLLVSAKQGSSSPLARPSLGSITSNDPALTENELKQFVAKELTNYKRPKFIEFRDELPKTPVGKILRRALRDELMKQKAA